MITAVFGPCRKLCSALAPIGVPSIEQSRSMSRVVHIALNRADKSRQVRSLARGRCPLPSTIHERLLRRRVAVALHLDGAEPLLDLLEIVRHQRWTACARRMDWAPASERPKCLNLPAAISFFHRSRNIFVRGIRIDAVLVEDIDAIGAQPLQCLVGDLTNTLGPAVEGPRQERRSRSRTWSQ